MKVVTCAGYYGSGSSAVTDYLSEFNNINCLGDFEFRFLQDPYGVSDLEFNIVENYHRHNTGFYLKKFKKLVDFLSDKNENAWYTGYNDFFNGNFKKISDEFIEELTLCSFNGNWHYDFYELGENYYRTYNKSLSKALFKYRVKKLLAIIFRQNLPKFYGPNNLKDEKTYIVNPEINFYEVVQKYTSKLLNELGSSAEYIMMDQLVPPSNSSRYLNYFQDLKIIRVDRNPLDIFISEKCYWKENVLPNDVNDFINWYNAIHYHRKKEVVDESRVLTINFEDFVLDYEKTTKTINEFLGIKKENHVNVFKMFDPKKSINNMNLLKKHPEFKEDADKIINNIIFKNYFS